MNPSSLAQAESLASLMRTSANALKRDTVPYPNLKIGVVPPFPFLPKVAEILKGSPVAVGAQDLHWEKGGAYTGAVSASMLKSIGASFVLCGHSERRSLFGDTDEIVAKKVRASVNAGLDVVLCVGETLAEFEEGLVGSVCALQLAKGLKGMSAKEAVKHLTIAYEPVWAIGTGLSATPQVAQEAHELIRQWLSERFGPEAASMIPIQYGGSVTPETAPALLKMKDIDGALVGGASLAADKFSSIMSSGAKEAPQQQQLTATSDVADPLEVFDALEKLRKIEDQKKNAEEALVKAQQKLQKHSYGISGGGVVFLEPEEVVGCGNSLGESPVWSHREQRLYWVDILGRQLWSWDPLTSPYTAKSVTMPSMVGCVALREGGGVVVALQDGFYRFITNTFNGEPVLDLIADWKETKIHGLDTRPNDGRVDRYGNFIVGSYNFQHKQDAEEIGSVYMLKGDSTLEAINAPKHRVSNCISFSPDGRLMYFADTPNRRIFQYDYDPDNRWSTLSNPRLFYELPASMPGMPDGANVDAQGGLWVAISGGSQVIRINPNGQVDHIVRTPCKSPTSVTIGGPELDTLFITTRAPDGGSLFTAKLPDGIRGIAEAEFFDEGRNAAGSRLESTAGAMIGTAHRLESQGASTFYDYYNYGSSNDASTSSSQQQQPSQSFSSF